MTNPSHEKGSVSDWTLSVKSSCVTEKKIFLCVSHAATWKIFFILKYRGCETPVSTDSTRWWKNPQHQNLIYLQVLYLSCTSLIIYSPQTICCKLKTVCFPSRNILVLCTILTKTCYFPVQHNSQSKGHQINPRFRIPCPLLKLLIPTIIASKF